VRRRFYRSVLSLAMRLKPPKISCLRGKTRLPQDEFSYRDSTSSGNPQAVRILLSDKRREAPNVLLKMFEQNVGSAASLRLSEKNTNSLPGFPSWWNRGKKIRPAEV